MTTSIKGIQQTRLKESKDKQQLLKEEDIAEALAERNVLRLTHTIQISSNKQFLAITFQNTQIMETFCTEPLLVRRFNNTLRPKKDFPQKRKTLKHKLPQHPSRNPRRTLNRIPVPICRYRWKPPTHPKKP